MRKMENEQIIRMLKSVLERMTTTYGNGHQDTLKLKRVIADFEAKEITKRTMDSSEDKTALAEQARKGDKASKTCSNCRWDLCSETRYPCWGCETVIKIKTHWQTLMTEKEIEELEAKRKNNLRTIW